LLLSHVKKFLLISTCSIFLFFSSYITPAYAETASAIQQYFVSKGDTLWLLAERYGTTVDKLTGWNPQAQSGLLPGQALILPVYLENGSVRYTVQRGDTLYLISTRANRSINEIMKASSLTSDALVPGQNLYLPAARTGLSYYLVKSGDMLWSIAKNHNVSVEELMAINRLSSSSIYVGQILEIPGQNQISDSNVSLYRVKSGDYLSVVAQKFGTTLDGIYQTNKLHSDILMPGQPLFIPKGREAVQVTGPIGLKKTGKGEFLPWNWARWVYNNGATATIIDYQTGKKFQVRYMGGSNHADSEPLTAQDSAIMASLYPNGWSWSTRPILLQIGTRTLAASIAGMPHSIDTIPNNNFDGHFDLYFYNSTSHNTNTIQPNHQNNVLEAAGISAAEADTFVSKLEASFSSF